MTQDKDIGNLVLSSKNHYIQWQEFITILIESKDLDKVLSKNDTSNSENESEATEDTSLKEKKAKVLTIIRKYLDINLHYLIHGIKDPVEVFNIIEKYCIGNKAERILKLEDSLSNPEGR
eukprot:snap_masked-scaffold_7-processed-gene-0.4-mRNA-1 protein AED:1.00 eAED:1.00 QI:0/-1/0/0/-1/1/1/0/119